MNQNVKKKFQKDWDLLKWTAGPFSFRPSCFWSWWSSWQSVWSDFSFNELNITGPAFHCDLRGKTTLKKLFNAICFPVPIFLISYSIASKISKSTAVTFLHCIAFGRILKTTLVQQSQQAKQCVTSCNHLDLCLLFTEAHNAVPSL